MGGWKGQREERGKKEEKGKGKGREKDESRSEKPRQELPKTWREERKRSGRRNPNVKKVVQASVYPSDPKRTPISPFFG